MAKVDSKSKQIVGLIVTILSLLFAGFQFTAAKRANNIADKALSQARIESKRADSLSLLVIAEERRANDQQQKINSLSEPSLELQYLTITDFQTMEDFLLGSVEEKYRDFFGLGENNIFIPTGSVQALMTLKSIIDGNSLNYQSKAAVDLLVANNRISRETAIELLKADYVTGNIRNSTQMDVLLIRNTGGSAARDVKFHVEQASKSGKELKVIPMVRGGSIPAKTGVIVPLSLYNYNLYDSTEDGVSLSPYTKVEKIQFNSMGDKLTMKVRSRYEKGVATLQLGRFTAQCPFVFTGPDLDFNEGPFLININKKEKKRTVRVELDNFKGKVKISELEPETSFIDMVRVEIHRDGNIITLNPNVEQLFNSDNQSITLDFQDSIEVAFYPSYNPELGDRVYFVTTGYYIPYEYPY